jgi:uncharacterized protein (DUF1015 family)
MRPMPRFEPFSGLRYAPSHVKSLDDVLCPPYDVISDAERAALVARSPSNIVRIELPRCEDGEDAYKVAALLLDAWRDGGILHRDHRPAFYGYRMSFVDGTGERRSTVGVIGALGLEEPGSAILPHEQTTPKAKSDRLELLRATRANLSPIWGLSPAAGLTRLLGAPSHPAQRSVDDDGVVHELWPITDQDQVDEIADAVGSAPVVLADGHHRYETALEFREERRRETEQAAGDHDLVMALIVELADEQLSVGAIHRLVDGLPEGTDLLAVLGEGFELEPTEPPDPTIEARMRDAGALGVLTPSGTWLAHPRPQVAAAAGHDLDASRLDAARRSWPTHRLEFQHGWAECAEAVAAGRAQAAILLRPATVHQIAAVAEGGDRMPPKTTFFWPKPRTGLVIRELID